MNELTKILNPAETKNLAEFEDIISAGLARFYQVGSALARIRDENLYRATHGTFEEYCEDRWEMTKGYGVQLIEGATIVDNLRVAGEAQMLLPWSERQIRPLAKLSPENQRVAWEAATRTNPHPSAKTVKEVVVELWKKVKAAAKPAAEGGSRTGATKDGKATSWTNDELKADKELLAALTLISLAVGNDDARAFRDGTIGYKRTEVIALSELSTKVIKDLRDLIFETRWTPADCVKFTNEMMDEKSTVEELLRWSLAAPDKIFRGDINGRIVFVCPIAEAGKHRL